jgi:hypothetical protein
MRNLVIGKPINVDDPATCAIKLDMPEFAWKLATLILPEVVNALQEVPHGNHTGAIMVQSASKCYYNGAMAALSILGGIACILATFGKCTPVAVKKIVKTGVKSSVKGAYYCTEHRNNGGCMPGDALVMMSDAGLRAISHVRVGDRIMSRGEAAGLSFAPIYSDVYLLGHEERHKYSTFVSIGLESGHVVELTPGHFIHTVPSLATALAGGSSSTHRPLQMYMKCASDVRVGDFVMSIQEGLLVPSLVANITTVEKWGLYNPYTLTGDLVVNGVLVSAHSDWVFDRITPAAYVHKLPGLYQAMMTPARWAYYLGGDQAMRFLIGGLNVVEVASKVAM